MPIPGYGEVAEKLRRSTVHVSAGRRGQGSGLIVKPDGVIITNAHVAVSAHVAASRAIIEVEFWDGTRAQANVELRDKRHDIAVLRVPRTELSAAMLADSDQLRVGELVIAVGNPLGFRGALTTGVVHAVGRVPGLGPMKWIQADVQLAPGNSGGPLANARGEVVGINTMAGYGGAAFAVPINTVARLLKGDSHVPLGIVARPVQIAVNGRARFGLMILETMKNGAAEAASLMLSDIVIGADGHAFDSIDDLERALEGSGERVVHIEFLRGERSNVRSVAVQIGLRSMAAA
jgi:serine protease Do